MLFYNMQSSVLLCLLVATDLFNCLSKHSTDPCKQIFCSRSERGCANRDRSIAAEPDIDHG